MKKLNKTKVQKKTKKKIASNKLLEFLKNHREMIYLSLKWLLVILTWVVTIILVILAYYAIDLPDVSAIENIKKQQKITMLDSSGKIITNYGDLYGKYIKYEQIPTNLINAVIATEDRRFFDHFGIDIFGIIRASYRNYRAKRIVQGGSTITQQLAKIVFLKSEKTLKRKIQEFELALYLEYKFSKKQIITIYLNNVYLGSSIFGVDAGAKYYFGKNLKDINLGEAAILAGLLKAPTRYSPVNNLESSGKRAYQILYNMYDAGYINKEEVKIAKNTSIKLETSAMGSTKNFYFSDWIFDQIENFVKTDEDIIVKTTLNSELQVNAEEIVKNTIFEQGKKLNVTQAALISIGKKGNILSMIGGVDYRKSEFNRVTSSRRQPGSTFKIFVYLAALENGYDPGSIIEDSPIRIKNWQPKNYSRNYLGNITIREAFAKSVNTISVKLSENIGRNKIIKIANSMGIDSKIMNHPSLALGTSEVSLLELTNGFATIKNNGFKSAIYGIEEVKTTTGKILYKHQQKIGKKLISEKSINDIEDLLYNSVRDGTGIKALLPIATYGKTGTTQNYHDAWFVGYAGDTITGIWVGNDNNAKMNKVTGGGLPAIIWKEYMMDSLNLNRKEIQNDIFNILDSEIEE